MYNGALKAIALDHCRSAIATISAPLDPDLMLAGAFLRLKCRGRIESCTPANYGSQKIDHTLVGDVIRQRCWIIPSILTVKYQICCITPI